MPPALRADGVWTQGARFARRRRRYGYRRCARAGCRRGAKKLAAEIAVDKRMRRSLAVALFAWVAFVVVLSALRERHPGKTSLPVVELPVYPEAVNVERHTLSTTDWQSVRYNVQMACPSDEVHRFYDEWFQENGWHRLAEQKPSWRRLARGEKATMVFAAAWADTDELRRADLRLSCAETEAGRSDTDVNCTMMRAIIPRARESAATGR